MSEDEQEHHSLAVSVKTRVYTFATLYESARVIRAARPAENWYGKKFDLGAMLLSVFAVEAYLNHVGLIEGIDGWAEKERQLSLIDKLNFLNGRLQLGINRRLPPFRSLLDMVAFRHSMVHGKTEILTATLEGTLDDDDFSTARLKANWETLLTIETEARFFDDAAAIIRDVERRRGSSDDPLTVMGWSSATPL